MPSLVVLSARRAVQTVTYGAASVNVAAPEGCSQKCDTIVSEPVSKLDCPLLKFFAVLAVFAVELLQNRGYDYTSVTSMQSLGSILKQAREKRELTLTAAAAQTRISSRHLQSLEEGRYRDLPGGMYNRAFLRAYGEFLGLDPKPLLERLQAESTVPVDKTVRPRARVPAESSGFHLHPLWVWGFMLLLSVAGVFFSRHWIASVFSPYVSKPAAAPVTALPPIIPAQSRPKDVSQPAPVPVESSPVPTEPAAGTVPAALARSGIHIRLEVLQTCWASVSSDGKSVLTRELNPGDDRAFDAAERITIVLGNAGGIRLTINDKPAKPLGKPGQVVRVVLTERSIPDFLESPAGQRP